MASDAGRAGQRGTADDTQAQGGDGEGVGSGNGGGGGYAAQIDGDAGEMVCNIDASDSGGGGGAVGRIRLNTLSPAVLPNVISPSDTTQAVSHGNLPTR